LCCSPSGFPVFIAFCPLLTFVKVDAKVNELSNLHPADIRHRQTALNPGEYYFV